MHRHLARVVREFQRGVDDGERPGRQGRKPPLTKRRTRR